MLLFKKNIKNLINLFAVVIECYEWLLCYLLDVTSKHMKSSIEKGNHRFVARNDAQVYKARDLSKAYAEFFALNSFK